MDIKKTVILSIVVFLVVIGGFFLSPKGSKVTPKINPVTVGTGAISAQESVESFQDREARLRAEKAKQYDYYNQAGDSMDETLCESIVGNDELKAQCMDNVFAAKASKNKDVSSCEKIKDTQTASRCKNSFLYDEAIKSNTVASCDKIAGDSELQSACKKNVVFTQVELGGFSGSTAICTSLTGADKDYCVNRITKDTDISILQKATATNSITLCATIGDTTLKNTCSDTLNLQTAISTQNIGLCSSIVDAGKKSTCTASLAKLSDVAVFQKAMGTNDLSACATIVTPDLKTKCSDTIYLKQGISTKNLPLCGKITDSATKKQCIDSINLINQQQQK